VEHLTLEIIEKVQAILAEDGRDSASQGAGSPIREFGSTHRSLSCLRM
jgi:hypothetical protein